jgi:predicted nucleotidyltransferase component of viral defense system
MIVDSIKKELDSKNLVSDIIKIWYIKEFLQAHILKELFNLEEGKKLIFYGGTSLRFLFWLNRLSEDLDFVWKDFDEFEKLALKIQKYFKQFEIKVNYKIQKFRIILNFKDFLDNFNLTFWNSKDLYIKIEISDYFDFCKNYNIKIYPIFKFSNSILIQSFDKQTLFSTKINAVLNRKWERQIWEKKVFVKWRDIYDLFWYLSNGVSPNLDCIVWVNTKEELKEKLLSVIENIDFQQVVYDIENFLEDKNLLEFFKQNWKEFLIEKIKEQI